MSDTPRTDAEAERCSVWENGAVQRGMVTAEFARRLERELNEVWEALRDPRAAKIFYMATLWEERAKSDFVAPDPKGTVVKHGKKRG